MSLTVCPPSESVAASVEALARRLAGLCPAGPAAAGVGASAVEAIVSNGRLESGKVHEWIGVDEGDGEHRRGAVRAPWAPPLMLLLEMAGREAAAGEEGRGGRDRLVWIGENVWPYPASLAWDRGRGGGRLLDRCLFVRAWRPADRLWAADLALRSRTAAAVIVDGSGLDLASTRRLQLAAEAGGRGREGGGGSGGICLLARPAWERRELSAAATRWLVSNPSSPSMNRRWTVELLRCKGLQPAPGAPRAWVVERDRATRSVRVVADVLDRPGEEAAGETAVRRTG